MKNSAREVRVPALLVQNKIAVQVNISIIL